MDPVGAASTSEIRGKSKFRLDLISLKPSSLLELTIPAVLFAFEGAASPRGRDGSEMPLWLSGAVETIGRKSNWPSTCVSSSCPRV
jgi:hypothetical protein